MISIKSPAGGVCEFSPDMVYPAPLRGSSEHIWKDVINWTNKQPIFFLNHSLIVFNSKSIHHVCKNIWILFKRWLSYYYRWFHSDRCHHQCMTSFLMWIFEPFSLLGMESGYSECRSNITTSKDSRVTLEQISYIGQKQDNFHLKQVQYILR
jgi:hypothetical protein